MASINSASLTIHSKKDWIIATGLATVLVPT